MYPYIINYLSALLTNLVNQLGICSDGCILVQLTIIILFFFLYIKVLIYLSFFLTNYLTKNRLIYNLIIIVLVLGLYLIINWLTTKLLFLTGAIERIEEVMI
jgi:hypothetical protein